MSELPPSQPTVAAIIVTRNRIEFLRETLRSLGQGAYPLTQIIVSDDSTDDSTREMLAAEFPDVLWVQGPRRGLSANRNNGVKTAETDYVLITDDDMLIDADFVAAAMRLAQSSTKGLFFTAVSEFGTSIVPNGLDFLGFATKPYAEGAPYHTANQQCFIVSTEVARRFPYDELIAVYGYEEMDYAYRIAAGGFPIRFIRGYVNVHTDPKHDRPFRPEQDAGRLYVTFKRYAYIDRRPLKALAFLCVAIPHHILAMMKRYGPGGISVAFANFSLARQMLRNFKASDETRDST